MRGTKFSFDFQAFSKSLCQANAHHSHFSLLQCWGDFESLLPMQCSIKISLCYLRGSPCQKCLTWIAISDLSFVNLGLFSLIKSKLFFLFFFFSSVPHLCSLEPFPLAMSSFTGLSSCFAVPYSIFLWQLVCTHHFCPLLIFHYPRNFLIHCLASTSCSPSTYNTLFGVSRFDHLLVFNPTFWTVLSLDQLDFRVESLIPWPPISTQTLMLSAQTPI